MYNKKPYNTSEYNNNFGGVISLPQDNIVFNGLSLQNENFRIISTNFDNSHNLENETYNRPLTDGVGELNHFFREKIVTFECYLKTKTAEELNNEVDRLKKILLQNGKYLDYKVNGVIRSAKATLQNTGSIFYRNHYNITYLPLTLEFKVFEFFKEKKANNIDFINKTTGFNEEFYNYGSAMTDFSVLLSFNSASGVNEIKFTDEKYIKINETINSGDTIKIDTFEKQVLLNGIDIDYEGEFPRLFPGINKYSIEINGSKNYNFNLKYFNTYL